MLKKKHVILVYIIIMTTLLLSCKSSKLSDLKHNDIVTLSGKINLIGNIPFTKYALTVTKHHYSIILKTEHDNLKTIIKNNLGKTLHITGKIIIKDIKSADLKYSIKKYELIVTHITL
tara:strand:- start:106 stop:459 length:354 start_codon:yes stop_codon:yes gene_type:complete